MSIQIEEGKYYYDSNGVSVGPMRLCDPGTVDNHEGPAFFEEGFFGQWAPDGEVIYGEYRSRLIEEIVVPPIKRPMLSAEAIAELTAPDPVLPPDVKAAILEEAGKIVNGARRSAYGTPERNFERIARFWQAYFENTGRGNVNITAADVSPLMRLMKEARLCESPTHRDSFVDIIGYTLTGAEVNGVKADA